MRINRKNNVEIELVGGIGNQLFGYFAAVYYAERFKKNLILDFRQIPLGVTNHGSKITSFRLKGDQKNTTLSKGKTNYYLKRLLDRLAREFIFVNYLRLKIFGIYQSVEIGYDKFLDNNSKISRMQGYFQTWKYYESLQKSNFDIKLDLLNPSDSFIQLLKEIKSSNCVGVHVRRGDYKNPKTSVGLLSKDYYKKAISQINKEILSPVYWIFSDDIDEAKLLLADFIPRDSKWVIPLDLAEPAESLVLMSYMKAVVIANSSFSWWAAVSNTRKELVIAPYPWFEKIETPKDLIPISWKVIQSSWM